MRRLASVLFIDDDMSFLRVNRIYFEKHGFRVFTAKNVSEAQKIWTDEDLDCIVLDILMPETDGWEICRQLQEREMPPVIFLTSLTEQECIYRGFEMGAADYLTKPYELRELELRVNARIRGTHGFRQELLSYGPLVIDVGLRRAIVNGKVLALTAYEFDILLLLARRPEKIFSLEEIYRVIWKLPDLGNVHTVRTHLARMRCKLEDALPDCRYIGRRWGKGFYFCPDGKEEEAD